MTRGSAAAISAGIAPAAATGSSVIGEARAKMSAISVVYGCFFATCKSSSTSEYVIECRVITINRCRCLSPRKNRNRVERILVSCGGGPSGEAASRPAQYLTDGIVQPEEQLALQEQHKVILVPQKVNQDGVYGVSAAP